MNVHLTPVEVLAGLGGFGALALIWRASTAAARRAAEAARSSARLMSLGGRVVVTAAVIAGVQWIVVTHTASNQTLVWVVLGAPALVASHTITRALTVTTTDAPRRKRGGRR